MLQQIMLSLNIIEKFSFKTSKAMKLSKSYSFKNSKSNEIISFTFPFIDAHSKILREKDSIWNRFFTHKGRLFPSKTSEKRPEYDNFCLFLRPSIIPLYKKSSLYFKSVDFLSKNYRNVCSGKSCIYRHFILKKVDIDKISEDNNICESVLMNVAPLYFSKCCF